MIKLCYLRLYHARVGANSIYRRPVVKNCEEAGGVLAYFGERFRSV